MYDPYTVDSIFAHLSQKLQGRKNCQTAKDIIAQEGVIFALRHARPKNPLNIRIVERKSLWKPIGLSAGCLAIILALAFSTAHTSRTSAFRAQEGTVLQTTTLPTLPDNQTEFHSVEE